MSRSIRTKKTMKFVPDTKTTDKPENFDRFALSSRVYSDSFYEMAIEYASLHLCESVDPYVIMKYLDRKPYSDRRAGAFSFVVALLGSNTYLTTKTGQNFHFLIDNNVYSTVYLQYGGSFDIAISKGSNIRLKDRYNYYNTNLINTTNAITMYHGLGMNAPYYYGKLASDKDFDVLPQDYHTVCVDACVGVHMNKNVTGKLTEEKTREILNYFHSIKQLDTDVDFYLECTENIIPYFKNLVSSWHNCIIPIDIYQNLGDILLDDTMTKLSNIDGNYIRIYDGFNYGTISQILGIPFHDKFYEVTSDLISDIFAAAKENMDSTLKRVRTINFSTVDSLKAKLSLQYNDVVINGGSNYEKNPLLSYSPVDIFIFNEDNIIFILKRDSLESVIQTRINPYTEARINDSWIDKMKMRLDFLQYHDLLTPAPVGELLQFIEELDDNVVPAFPQ